MSEPLVSTLGDDPDLAELIDEYVAALAGRMRDIERAVAAGDSKRVEVLAHQIVGSAGMHGFATIGEAARRVELAAFRGDGDALAEGVRALAALCARARAR
jgi:HPt (histidine-containing phosphotransfer) domain-containing protein